MAIRKVEREPSVGSRVPKDTPGSMQRQAGITRTFTTNKIGKASGRGKNFNAKA